MKLTENQAKVIKLLQEGWELGVDTDQIGYTRINRTVRLQKHGLGHGEPIETARISTIEALVKKGLLQRIPNPYIMTQPTRYQLTEKGREWKV